MSDEMTQLSTEQRNPNTMALDQLPVADLVNTILDEDAIVPAAVRAVAPQVATAVELAVRTIRMGGRLHYVGAGTSGRLAVLDAAELYPTYHVGSEWVVAHMAGGDEALTRAVEGAEDDEGLGASISHHAGPRDMIIGVAASGRTPFVTGALFAARERGLATVLISSNPRAPLAELVDVAILPNVGPEVVTGSTRMKSGTAQKLILNALSTATMVRMGKTYSNLMISLVATNDKLRARVVRVLQQATGLPDDVCAQAAAEANGDLRLALVALLGNVSVDDAAKALADLPLDSMRTDDPAGVRTALQRLG